MAHDSAKILVVASGEDSREASYIIVRGLKDHGHVPLICCSPEAKTKIKPDFPLDENTSLGGISGVVILDDGGDPKSCALLTKKANEEDLVVGGIGKGCLIMASCGILKDHYVCDGLPEDAYSEDGVIRVESPSARSDTVLTCSDMRMAEGFLALVIDALGGKAKRVVTGQDEPVTEASLLIIDEPSSWPSYWKAAMRLSSLGRRAFIGRWEDVDVGVGTASCLSLDADGVRNCRIVGIPKTILFRQDMPLSMAASAVSELESLGCRNVNSSESIRLASAPLDQVLGGIVDVEESDDGIMIVANRRPDGWKAEADGNVKDAVEVACTAFQASLEDHEGANSVSVRVTLRDDRPTINGIDPLAPDVEPQAQEDDPSVLRSVIEREMANEGMWIQPDGRMAILEDGKFNRLEPEDAIRELRSLALKAVRKEIEEEHRGKDDLAMRRARRLSRRARHRLFLAFELLNKAPQGLVHSRFESVDRRPTFFCLPGSDSKQAAMEASSYARSTGSPVDFVADGSVMEIGPDDVMFEHEGRISRKAGIYPSGVAGPWANLDVPMFERVFEYKEEDEYLKDREKAISKQPRYNPEYDLYGFYFKWVEPRNLAYSWEKRFEEGSYPMRNVLNLNR